MTEEEKPYWDKLAADKAKYDAEIAELEKLLAEDPSPYREQILQEIERLKKMRELITELLPD
jgi:hypothetical protein